MPLLNSPKKLITRSPIKKPTATTADAATIIKKKAPIHYRADGSNGSGLFGKKDLYGNPFYKFWKKGDCPPEHRQIVFVKVDAAAEKLGLQSGAWSFQKMRQHSITRLNQIPHYVKFGAELSLFIPKWQRDHDVAKGHFGAVWKEGSDRSGYYNAVTPDWQHENLHASGYASPEAYHDVQRAAEMSKFE